MSGHNSHELLKRYEAGDDEAAADIFDRYVQRLIALARSRISAKLKRRIDPDDVVQSAYRSFFMHARNQEYLLARSGDLWRLLASITLNKLYGQIERQSAEKRTVDREQTAAGILLDATAPCPSAAEVVAVLEQLQLAFKDLTSDQRGVLSSMLQGQEIAEISQSLGKSERTVRRLLASARAKLEGRLTGEQKVKGRSARATVGRREPHAPLQYSDYVIEQLLGTGGMGKVYRARDRRSGEVVAIKALHKARQADLRAVSRFVRESQVLAKLHYPNIVGVHGLGRFPAGGYFMVMQFIEGTDLQRRLADRPFSVRDALRIVQQVAEAVQHAHENGILHCDLKPGNVLLDEQQRAVVTDFGFAVLIADRSRLSCNMVGGTAGYIAPEVLYGGESPTIAADIHGLGALLWALIAGAPPKERFDNRGVAPETVAAICERSLAANPKLRFATVAQFCEQVSEALNGVS